jgi:hypothetical protein
VFGLLGRPEGLERLGGVDFDEVVFEHVREALPEAFATLDPADPAVLAAVARIRRDCTEAKEALSADTEVTIPVLLPAARGSVRLHRSEFEGLVRTLVEETVTALRGAVTSAELTPEQLTAVLLVGGSSRIPLVTQLVSEGLGRPVAVDADRRRHREGRRAGRVRSRPRPGTGPPRAGRPRSAEGVGAAGAAARRPPDRAAAAARADPAPGRVRIGGPCASPRPAVRPPRARQRSGGPSRERDPGAVAGRRPAGGAGCWSARCARRRRRGGRGRDRAARRLRRGRRAGLRRRRTVPASAVSPTHDSGNPALGRPGSRRGRGPRAGWRRRRCGAPAGARNGRRRSPRGGLRRARGGGERRRPAVGAGCALGRWSRPGTRAVPGHALGDDRNPPGEAADPGGVEPRPPPAARTGGEPLDPVWSIARREPAAVAPPRPGRRRRRDGGAARGGGTERAVRELGPTAAPVPVGRRRAPQHPDPAADRGRHRLSCADLSRPVAGGPLRGRGRQGGILITVCALVLIGWGGLVAMLLNSVGALLQRDGALRATRRAGRAAAALPRRLGAGRAGLAVQRGRAALPARCRGAGRAGRGAIALTALAAPRLFGTVLRRVDRWAVAACLAGLVLVAASAGAARPPVRSPVVDVVLLVTVLLLAVAVLVLRRGRPGWPLAVVAGLGFGGGALAVRAAHVQSGPDPAALLTEPATYLLLGFWAVGLIGYTAALSRSDVASTTALLTVTEVLVPGLAGIVLLGDPVRAGWTPVLGAGLAIAVAGVVVLARSPVEPRGR